MTTHRPPVLHRVVELHDPDPLRVEVHDDRCPCFWCEGHRDEKALAAIVDAQLAAFCRAGWLSAAGFLIGTVIAFAMDAHGAAHALAAAFTWSA